MEFADISIWKGETNEKLIFAPFGKILVLVNAFFYLNFNSRSICISICIIFIYHQTNHLGLSEYSICEIWRLFTRGNLSTWWMCRSRGSTRASCWNWIAKTHSPKPRSCQKLQKSIFHYFFDLKLNRKNAFTKTKILPNGAKIDFSILF